MAEVLKDPFWEFIIRLIVAILAIVVSAVVAFVLYRLQRRRKALGYQIITRTTLLNVEEELEEKVQILFDGEKVADVHLLEVKVVNSGNVPIVRGDYERKLELSFGTSSRILTADVTETRPDSLRPELTIDAARDSVWVQPTLLNSGDWFTIKMLISRFDGNVDIDGRIVGVKDIAIVREGLLSRRMSAVILTGLLGMAVGGVGSWLSDRLAAGPRDLLFLVAIALLLTGCALGFLELAHGAHWACAGGGKRTSNV